MCYYTQQNASIEDLKRRFNAELDNEETYLQSHFINGFSHPNIPVILNSSPHLITTHYTWGLLPYWAKDIEFRKNTLNARIESIDEKASLKNITHNRCLIIASAYYKWHWNDEKGKSKDKYQINSQDDEIFTLQACIPRGDPVTDEIKNTYTMVTTKANKIMNFVHNHKHRMPIMLRKQDERHGWTSQWL